MNQPEPSPITSDSGSLRGTLGISSSYDYSLKGEERVISVMAQKLDELSREVYDLKQEKLLKETQLPPEVLERIGITSKAPRRLKRGRGYRPIMKQEILDVKETIRNARGDEFNEAMVARKLGISYITYKKYAKMYGVWEPKPYVKGKKGVYDPERGKYPLNEVLEGKHPKYPVWRIKDKLIRSKIKEEKCELCNYKEKRIVDGKCPLILNFMDGNPENHLLDNMKLYCYNCTFTSGRGYIRTGQHYFDPDWLQGANKDETEKDLEW